MNLSYLAGIGAAILGLGEHVALAGNVHTLGKCLVNGSLLAGHDACEVLHLLGANLSTMFLSALFPQLTSFAFPKYYCPGNIVDVVVAKVS